MSEKIRNYVMAADDADGVGTIEVSNENYTAERSSLSNNDGGSGNMVKNLIHRFKVFCDMVKFNVTDTIYTDQGTVCSTAG